MFICPSMDLEAAGTMPEPGMEQSNFNTCNITESGPQRVTPSSNGVFECPQPGCSMAFQTPDKLLFHYHESQLPQAKGAKQATSPTISQLLSVSGAAETSGPKKQHQEENQDEDEEAYSNNTRIQQWRTSLQLTRVWENLQAQLHPHRDHLQSHQRNLVWGVVLISSTTLLAVRSTMITTVPAIRVASMN